MCTESIMYVGNALQNTIVFFATAIGLQEKLENIKPILKCKNIVILQNNRTGPAFVTFSKPSL